MKDLQIQNRRKSALLIAHILLGIFIFLFFFGLYRAFGPQQMKEDISVSILSVVAGGVSWFARSQTLKGKLDLAGWILTLTVPVCFLLIVIFSPGNSWMIGMVVALVTTVIACSVLTSRHIGKGMFVAILMGGIIVYSDTIFRTPGMYTFPIDEVTAIGLVAAAIFIYLLVRAFNNLPVGAKTQLIIFFLTMTVASGISIIFILGIQSQVSKGLVTYSDPLEMESLFRMMIGIDAVLVVISSGIGLLASSMITRPLITVVDVLSGITSRGDISQKVVIKQGGELGVLRDSCNQMIDHFQRIADTTAKIARKDLTTSFEPKSDRDVLGIALREMTINLEELIRQITTSGEELNAAAALLKTTTNHSHQAIRQIANTIQQVAEGSTQQATSFNHTAAAVDSMSRTIQEVSEGTRQQGMAVGNASQATTRLSTSIQFVSSNATEQAHQAELSVSETRSSAEIVQATIRGMESIRSQVDLSANKVQEMGRQSAQIGAILETIEDIASQTNMLALNAAIEAARAGEHGKGFAVVADEVRKLAERSAVATREIATLIRSIQTAVSQAVSAMEESSKEVEKGVGLAGKAGTALEKIITTTETSRQSGEKIALAAGQMRSMAEELVKAMEAVSGVVDLNQKAVGLMSEQSGEVSKAIENIASVSQENTAAVEEVNASAEEMTVQVDEMSCSAEQFSRMADDLQKLLNQFKFNQ